MIVHKTMTLKKRKQLGYEGYLERASCNRRVYAGWCMPVKFLSRLWSRVTCKRCLETK